MESKDDVNDKVSKLLSGALVLVSAFMVTGFIGNVHVLLVYAFKMKSTNHRIFILFLSTVDLSVCVIGMPLSLYRLREPLFFASSATCILQAFSNYFFCMTSAFTLLVIAFERYRKICKTFGWQMSRRHAKYACMSVLVIAFLCSSPNVFLIDTYERQSLKYPGINATVCVDVYQNNVDYYHICLTVVFFISFISLIFLYTCIWKMIRFSNIHPTNKAYNVEEKNCSGSLSIKDLDSKITSAIVVKCDSNETIQKTKNVSGQSKHVGKSGKSVKPRKTTLAFSLITIVFFITYIPHLVLLLLMGMTELFDNLTDEEICVIHIGYYFVYFSNVANCFIYSCTDIRFRQEVKCFYVRLLGCK